MAGISSNTNIRPLNESEKEFLNKFYEEAVVSSFKRDGSDFYSSDEKRRELYRENNNRNACLYNFKQRTGQLHSFNGAIYDANYSKEIGHIDHEMLMVKNMELKDIAVIIRGMREEYALTFEAITEMVKLRFPDFFMISFTKKEQKTMGALELGETLYLEARIILGEG